VSGPQPAKEWLRWKLPPRAFSLLRRLNRSGPLIRARSRLADREDRRRGASDDQLVPPRRLWFDLHPDFRAPGERFRETCVELAGLRPDSRVLDVGCGVGRMAVPLTEFLREGSYEGFDLNREAIEWCSSRITPRHPNFRFQVADIYNGQYNPSGSQSASSYRFPFDDGSFDLVMLVSVFTHMLPADVENYLGEVARVLRSGGRCVATYFLVNPESEALLSEGGGDVRLSYEEVDERGRRFLAAERRTPEFGIGLEEELVRQLHRDHGIPVVDPIEYGRWPGRTTYRDAQDTVVAARD